MKISVYDRPDRKKKFGAKWTDGKKRRFKFFETETERDAFIKSFNSQVKKTGPALMSLSASDAVIMAECLKKVGTGAEVLRAVDEYARRAMVKSVPYAVAQKEFLDEKLNAGVDDDYWRHLENTTKKFQAAGSVASVTPTDARAWATALHNAPITNRNDIKLMNLFWNWIVERGYARENVFSAVPLPTVSEREPEFLTVDDARALMTAAQIHYPDAVAYFALGLFAGLRSSAICRLDLSEHIRFEQRGILITGERGRGGDM